MRILLYVLVCACLALFSWGANFVAKLPIGQESEMQSGGDYERVPVAPEGEETRESYEESVRNLLAAVRDSLARMEREAKEKGAKAEEIADGAREDCEARLREIEEADLGERSREELAEDMVELSEMITVLRTARDAISNL